MDFKKIFQRFRKPSYSFEILAPELPEEEITPSHISKLLHEGNAIVAWYDLAYSHMNGNPTNCGFENIGCVNESCSAYIFFRIDDTDLLSKYIIYIGDNLCMAGIDTVTKADNENITDITFNELKDARKVYVDANCGKDIGMFRPDKTFTEIREELKTTNRVHVGLVKKKAENEEN